MMWCNQIWTLRMSMHININDKVMPMTETCNLCAMNTMQRCDKYEKDLTPTIWTSDAQALHFSRCSVPKWCIRLQKSCCTDLWDLSPCCVPGKWVLIWNQHIVEKKCQVVESHDRCLQVRTRLRNSRSDPLVSCIPNPVSKKGNTRILTKNWMRLGRLQHPYSWCVWPWKWLMVSPIEAGTLRTCNSVATSRFHGWRFIHRNFAICNLDHAHSEIIHAH